MIGFTDEQKHRMAMHGAEHFADTFAKTLQGEAREALIAEIYPLELEDIEASERILPRPGIYDTRADDEYLKVSNRIMIRELEILPKYGIHPNIERLKKMITL